MKVARLVTYLDFGGIEKVVEIAALEFSRHFGIEHVVIVLGTGGRVADLLTKNGVEVICLDSNPKIPNLSLVLKLFRLFRRRGFDVVHTSGAEANFHGLFAAYLAGTKRRIAEEIGFPNHRGLWRLVFRFVYFFAHKVIAISEAVRDLLVSYGEIPFRKATVIYNPAQLPKDVYTPKREQNGIVSFVMVCRLAPIKNIPTTLHAFGKLNSSIKERVKLVIVGDGEQRAMLENLSIDLGLQNQVTFAGYQSDISDFLLNADVFLLPSLSEGSSVALTEAMLHGLPSIVTEVGGASEVVGSSNSAIFVNPRSITEIKRGLGFFLGISQADIRAMGIQASHFARENFSPGRYCENLLQLYNQRN